MAWRTAHTSNDTRHRIKAVFYGGIHGNKRCAFSIIFCQERWHWRHRGLHMQATIWGIVPKQDSERAWGYLAPTGGRQVRKRKRKGHPKCVAWFKHTTKCATIRQGYIRKSKFSIHKMIHDTLQIQDLEFLRQLKWDKVLRFWRFLDVGANFEELHIQA